MPPVEETGNGGRLHCLPRLSRAARRSFPCFLPRGVSGLASFSLPGGCVEACMETNAPLAENAAPAWALSVARPVRDGLHEELRDVPRPALQTIFGKSLGHRIWQQARAKAASAGTSHLDRVADGEISAGMVVYLSRQTSEALIESGRQAKSLSMTITYTDGEA